MYGGKNREVKADRTVPELVSRLATSGNGDAMVVIFPGIAHEQMLAINGYFDEVPLLEKYPAGYFGLFSSWVREHALQTKFVRQP